ncbi:MAG: hypothetical protein ABEJ28_10515 [Salinigranum sp.]
MANPLTVATKPLSTAKKVMDGRGGTEPDINEDLKETVKQAIYEVQDERKGSKSRSKTRGTAERAGRLALVGLGIAIGRRLSKVGLGSLGADRTGERTKIDVKSEEESAGRGSSDSGSSLLRWVGIVGALGGVGYVAYRWRKSNQSGTHIEHTGDVRHTDASKLPQTETDSSDAEPPYTSESSGPTDEDASGEAAVGATEDEDQ